MQSRFLKGTIDALIVIVIALIALGAIGYVAYRTYQAQHAKSSTVLSNSGKKNSSQSGSVSHVNLSITLAAGDFTFKAPAGWKEAAPPVIHTFPDGEGGTFREVVADFTDGAGNTVHIEEDGALDGSGGLVANQLWLVNDDEANDGITVHQKSPVCSTPGDRIFFFIYYTCNPSPSTTLVTAFMAAGGGEVLVGHYHKYIIQLTNDQSARADTSVFEAMLATFRSN